MSKDAVVWLIVASLGKCNENDKREYVNRDYRKQIKSLMGESTVSERVDEKKTNTMNT